MAARASPQARGLACTLTGRCPLAARGAGDPPGQAADTVRRRRGPVLAGPPGRPDAGPWTAPSDSQSADPAAAGLTELRRMSGLRRQLRLVAVTVVSDADGHHDGTRDSDKTRPAAQLKFGPSPTNAVHVVIL